MKLTCSSCQQQLVVDDSKVPASVFKIKCPKCGKMITGQKPASMSDTGSRPAAPKTSAADELQAVYLSQSNPAIVQPPASAPSNGENADKTDPASTEVLIKREVAAVRRELMHAMSSLFGGSGRHFGHSDGSQDDEDDGFTKKALICEDDESFIEVISAAVKHLGFSIDVARSTMEALKKVETGAFDLVTVDYVFPDDKEGGNKILAKLNGLPTQSRRETFVVLISASIKSSDANAA